MLLATLHMNHESLCLPNQSLFGSLNSIRELQTNMPYLSWRHLLLYMQKCCHALLAIMQCLLYSLFAFITWKLKLKHTRQMLAAS